MQRKKNCNYSSLVSTQARCAVKAVSPKRVLSLLLVLAMLVTLAPQSLLSGTNITADAGETQTTIQNPRIVTDSSMKSGQKVTWDCIRFGSYPQTEIVDKAETSGNNGKMWASKSDYEVDASLYEKLKAATYDANGDTTIDGTKYRRIKKGDATTSIGKAIYIYKWSDSTSYHYFRYDPIKWRVLDVKDGKALLLADKALDDQKYNTTATSQTWETSSLRRWLNGYDTDSTKNFIDSAFTSDEKNAIDTTSSVNNDKIFILSKTEVCTDTSKSYGFVSKNTTYDEARRCESSAFATAMGVIHMNKAYPTYCNWWLQSLGTYSNSAVYVNYGGDVDTNGHNFTNQYKGCRPALYLNLSSSDTFSYAGAVCSDGSVICAAHSLGEPQYIWSEDGTSCTAKISCKNADCAYELSEAGKITRTEKTPATCEGKGSVECTATFENNQFETKTITAEIAPTGHDYDYDYEWSKDGTMCVAVATCKKDAAHVVTAKGTITCEKKTAAGCTTKGTTTYTATFTNSNGTNFVQQTKDVQDIAATGHSFGEWTVTTPAACASAGIETRTCTNKGCSEKETREIAAAGHIYGEPQYIWSEDGKSCTAEVSCTRDGCGHKATESGMITSEVKTAATCTEKGTTTYTAAFRNSEGTSFTQQTKDVQDIAAAGHIYGEPQYIWSEDGKSCTAEVSCTRDGCTEKISENGTITSEVTIAATRKEKGTTTYTAKFNNSLFTDSTKSVQDIPEIQSSGETSTNAYNTTLPYNITLPKTVANGSIASSSVKAIKDDKISLTVKADDGYTLGTLKVVDQNGKSIEINTVDEDSNYSFIMPASDVTVEAAFKKIENATDKTSNTFADVTKDAYFYDAVQWAFNNKIATGTDASHFNPNGITNRAQAVTFLWRTAGEKTVDYKSPFNDVAEGSYYENAVRWACSEQIAKGMTDETFAPLSEVSRAQMITFLWRMAGSPKIDSSAAAGNESLSFSDVSADAYYYDAVRWAVSQGITAGTSDSVFSPDDKCTRAQVVTFIYRYKNGK